MTDTEQAEQEGPRRPDGESMADKAGRNESGPPLGPIEIFLTQANMEVICQVYYEDESSRSVFGISSLSLRGAQREMTADAISRGYKPDGRWKEEVQGETSRRFKVSKVEPAGVQP